MAGVVSLCLTMRVCAHALVRLLRFSSVAYGAIQNHTPNRPPRTHTLKYTHAVTHSPTVMLLAGVYS